MKRQESQEHKESQEKTGLRSSGFLPFLRFLKLVEGSSSRKAVLTGPSSLPPHLPRASERQPPVANPKRVAHFVLVEPLGMRWVERSDGGGLAQVTRDRSVCRKVAVVLEDSLLGFGKAIRVGADLGNPLVHELSPVASVEVAGRCCLFTLLVPGQSGKLALC